MTPRKSPVLSCLLGLSALLGLASVQAQPAATDNQSLSGAMSAEQLKAEPIRFELDLPYAATDNPRQRLDLYLPKEPKPPTSKSPANPQRPNRNAEPPKLSGLPVVVFLHGGGWSKGDKSVGAAAVMPFVRSGQFAAASVGYRLTDEANWPAPLHDVKAAIRWLRANADQYGIDPDRIAVWGHSAGAHLALMAGLTGDSELLEGELGEHRDQSSRVAAVVNYFGVTDMPALAEQDSEVDRKGTDSPEARLLGGALPDNLDRARDASPVTYATVGDPPVLTIHGDADRAVPYDQAQRLQTALQGAGVANYLIPVKGAGHGGFPTQAEERTRQFLHKVLYGMGEPVKTEALALQAVN